VTTPRRKFKGKRTGKKNTPAGARLARKIGTLTCRHPTGTHHTLY
jgi:hypothetical protein